MRNYTKIPLYLGLIVLAGSILTSAITVGQQKALTYQKTRAANSSATLTLNFSPPNLAGVYLTGNKEIEGIDIAIKFDPGEISVLPSSLTNGPAFTTSGGTTDEEGNTFSFSAIPNKNGVTTGIVASFILSPKASGKETNLEFVTGGEKTAVWEKTTGNNILTTATGVKFKLSP